MITALLVLAAVAWYAVGYAALVWAFTKDLDFKLGDALFCIPIAPVGVFCALIVALVDWDSPVLMERRR